VDAKTHVPGWTEWQLRLLLPQVHRETHDVRREAPGRFLLPDATKQIGVGLQAVSHSLNARHRSNATGTADAQLAHFASSWSAGSEVELCSELQHASPSGAGDLTEAGAAERRACGGTARRRAVGVIEEKLRRICCAEGLEAQV